MRVREYTLGGYQVIKKWLSYREKELPGRSLTADEARYVANVARRNRGDPADGAGARRQLPVP